MNEPNVQAMTGVIQEALQPGQLPEWQSPSVDGDAQRRRILSRSADGPSLG